MLIVLFKMVCQTREKELIGNIAHEAWEMCNGVTVHAT